MNKKFISWRRVSTFRQSKSGLGLEAQKEIIRYFVERDGGELIADYSECYTGTDLEGCTELRKAINHAKRENAILIIAKTDRFRNTIEALQVYEKMGDGRIMFCDLPHTDKFTLTLFFALAEREALIVSIRTKQALQAKKARGEKLGGASIKWQESYKLKSKEEKEEWIMKKGELKRERHHDSKDIVAFTKVLRNVFPLATVDDNPKKWSWMDINCKEANRIKILSMMRDYNDIDSSLFNKWDFDIGSQKVAQRLRSYMQSFQKSFTN